MQAELTKMYTLVLSMIGPMIKKNNIMQAELTKVYTKSLPMIGHVIKEQHYVG